jgi:putative FmdB family regulatory protein
LPTYEYRCENGHTFEVTQSMSDPPVTKCQVCGAPVERVFHPVAVHFKGSGFYTTDYGRKSGAGASSSDSGSKDESSKTETTTSKSDSGSGGGSDSGSSSSSSSSSGSD